MCSKDANIQTKSKQHTNISILRFVNKVVLIFLWDLEKLWEDGCRSIILTTKLKERRT